MLHSSVSPSTHNYTKIKRKADGKAYITILLGRVFVYVGMKYYDCDTHTQPYNILINFYKAYIEIETHFRNKLDITPLPIIVYHTKHLEAFHIWVIH